MDENGNYIESIERAYEQFHNKFGKVRRVLRETAVGTLVIKLYRLVMASIYVNNTFDIKRLWLAHAHAEGGDNQDTSDKEELLRRYEVTYQAIRHVQHLANQAGAEYLTLLIPSLGPGCLTSPDFSLERQKKMFHDFRPVYADLSIDHYRPLPDCHLNNAGHLVIARRLQEVLGTFAANQPRQRGLGDPS